MVSTKLHGLKSSFWNGKWGQSGAQGKCAEAGSGGSWWGPSGSGRRQPVTTDINHLVMDTQSTVSQEWQLLSPRIVRVLEIQWRRATLALTHECAGLKTGAWRKLRWRAGGMPGTQSPIRGCYLKLGLSAVSCHVEVNANVKKSQQPHYQRCILRKKIRNQFFVFKTIQQALVNLRIKRNKTTWIPWGLWSL